MECPRTYYSCPPLGSDIPRDVHFQNMPDFLAEAPELSKSQVMGWSLLLNPGKLNGLVPPLPQVLAEQSTTRHGPSTLVSGLEHPLGGHRRSCPASAFLLGPVGSGKVGPSGSFVG